MREFNSYKREVFNRLMCMCIPIVVVGSFIVYCTSTLWSAIVNALITSSISLILATVKIKKTMLPLEEKAKRITGVFFRESNDICVNLPLERSSSYKRTISNVIRTLTHEDIHKAIDDVFDDHTLDEEDVVKKMMGDK